MSRKSLFERQTGRLFKPKIFRTTNKSAGFLQTPSSGDVKLSENFFNTNLESSSSFRYGDKKGIVSTQQLRIDWEKFENHTFFHSAVAKVNESFDRLVNFYPFEKSRKRIEKFEDDLTGYEKYILDIFPKNVGYLNFSGTQVGEATTNGTQISVVDKKGFTVGSISDLKDGQPVLDPKDNPCSVDFFIKIPTQVNDNQVIFQKRNSLANNLTIALSESNSTTKCDIHFFINSGSNFSVVSGSVSKGTFSHIYAMYDLVNDQRLKLLINDNIHSSSQQTDFGLLNYNGSNLTIATGQDARVGNTVFTNRQTFSGSIDDLKYFHSVDPVKEVKQRKRQSFYRNDADDTLKLYFKFNEPYGVYAGNNLALDSSGNSLHSYVTNFSVSNRLTGSDVPLSSEDINRNPVLFPAFPKVTTLNTRLLTTASLYDDYNPNLIINLVPKHYFQDGTQFRDYEEEMDRLQNNFSTFSSNQPGKNISEIPETQLLIKLLLSYSKYFDELKLLIDGITSFRHTSYNDYDTTPDPLLQEKAQLLNVTLPSLFSYGQTKQIFEGINLRSDARKSTKSLIELQNLIWRRIISEAPRVNLSRGTIRSIKSVFRSSGIEPDNILTIREYGGSKVKSLSASKELKRDVFKFLTFSGSIGKVTTSNTPQGYPTNIEIPKIKTTFLSGSRTQVGRPTPRGAFVNKDDINVHGVSNNTSDGLLTSGSFTFEAFYNFPGGYRNNQSLIRLHTTGTSNPSSTESVVTNLIASNDYLRLYFKDSPTDLTTRELFLTGVNIFDSDTWYVSFGKENTHDLNTVGTSSYFLRAAKQLNGDIISQYHTASIFDEHSDSVFKNISAYNTSGSFLVIGSQSFQNPGSGNLFINGSSTTADAKVTDFHGMLTNLRFFSKNTTLKEFRNRSKNYDSFGVTDPSINYNFTNASTGSYERLILNTDSKQFTTGTDAAGSIRLFDFSQNNFHFNGTNFEASKDVFKNLRVNFEVLSDKFDLNYTRDKVRIRSFQDAENIEDGHFSTIAPVHEILPSEEATDDNRLSVDMSVMKGLNDNMLRMFDDFDKLENAFGNPNLIFGETYPEIRHLRDVYFNNVLDVLNLQKYRELFKWVDNAFEEVLYSIVPRTTNFLGVNFIYESHVLERNRFKYLYDEIYMKSIQRDGNRGNLLLSQFVAKVKKH